MEYYILSIEDKYITDTVINNNNEIIHNFTDNIELARRFEDLESANKQADFLNCSIVKIKITKEKIGE